MCRSIFHLLMTNCPEILRQIRDELQLLVIYNFYDSRLPSVRFSLLYSHIITTMYINIIDNVGTQFDSWTIQIMNHDLSWLLLLPFWTLHNPISSSG